MGRKGRKGRGGIILVVLTLAVSVLGLPALGQVAVKAPVGTWAGLTGDGNNDYGVLSIAQGKAGEQSGFYVEEIVGPCDGGTAVIFGTATIAGDTVNLHGPFICVDTGVAFNDDFHLNFTYRETGTMYWGDFSDYDIEWAKACPLRRKDMGKFGASGIVVKGTSEDETIEGTPFNDIIDGKGGDDTLIGWCGIDVLCGGKGNDTLEGFNHVDVLIGGNGKDTIFGGNGWDFATGAGSKDTLWGDAGTDFLLGGFKRDTITGGFGPNDVAIGDGGADTCDAEIMVNC